MSEAISQEDWLQWKNSPVTQAYLSYLDERKAAYTEQMLNLDPTQSDLTVEQYGLKMANMRVFIDALAQASSINVIEEVLTDEC